MDFNELIAGFATRYNVADLAAQDGVATVEIDGIIVSIVSKDDEVAFSAEIGEAPAEGAAVFANVLLEANLQSGEVFAKLPDAATYVITRRLSLPTLDEIAFDVALEAFVNQTETWRGLLADFRPAATAAAEMDAAAAVPSLGSDGFIQV